MPSDFYIRSMQVSAYGHLAFEGEANLKPGVNVLIGKNGSGKTTLLTMIREAADNGGIRKPLGPEDQLPSVLARLQLHRGVEPETSVEFRKGHEKFSSWESLQGRVRYIVSHRSVKSDMKVKSLLGNPEALLQVTEPTQEINVADEFQRAVNSELYQRIKSAMSGLDSITSGLEQEYREGLVDFEKEIHLDFERDKPIYFIDHLGRELDITHLSSGEQEFLYFFAYLRRIRSERDMIILVDEPELHLHASQVRRLCDLLAEIGTNNQVIVATHSPEVLQHFLATGNVVLLERGRIRNVRVAGDIEELIATLGLPVDPSVFTAHWVAAENSRDSTLPGTRAPTTVEVLRWLLGASIERRYWACGSAHAATASSVELLNEASGGKTDIRLSIVLDGDMLVVGPSTWPPVLPSSTGNIGVQRHYMPCWEIENLFLNPRLLKQIAIENEDLESTLWRLLAIPSNRAAVTKSILRTMVKNEIRASLRDKRIDSSPLDDLDQYRARLSKIELTAAAVEAKFDALLKERNWQWIPGKEALGLLVGQVPDFWNRVRGLETAVLSEVLSDGPGFNDLADSIKSVE